MDKFLNFKKVNEFETELYKVNALEEELERR